MRPDRLFSWKSHWFSFSVGVTASLVVVCMIAGFVILPYATADAQFAGIWDAICSAAGVPRTTAVLESVKSSVKTSDVVLAAQLAEPRDTRSVGRGATLAMQCAICHGSNRQSQVDTPNLEGQPAAAIYKQLRDFKTGVRTNAVMSPFAVKLSDQDMQDIAAYYSYMPRQPGMHPSPTVPAPLIVAHGAPMRNVPACSSCHGGADFKAGSPWLEGQSAIYIKAQLQAFAAGTRRNDISEQMRNIARRMTPQEIDDASRYFASRP